MRADTARKRSTAFNIMPHHKQIISWLNDAHSMERSLVNVLENHRKDAAEFPDMRTRLEQHLDETRRHVEMVEECLRQLGEKPSMSKGMMGAVMGKVQGVATGMFRDEMIKNALADYSAEHLEIASYRSLIAAAEELGLSDVARICSEILRDEEAMAGWLEERIPEITRLTLQKHGAGV